MKRSVKMMGTTVSITLINPKDHHLMDSVFKLLHTYENRFSANDPTSELSIININAGIKPVVVHPDLFELIKIGKHHSLASQSNLNIMIGPVVKAWHIGFTDAHKPSDDIIQDTLKRSDPGDLILNPDESTVFLKLKGMEIDLGCIAKGYITDKIIEFLKASHVEDALVDLGGNIATLSTSKNWRIGLQEPFQKHETHQMVLNINNQSIVTSGIYERILKVNGHSYHHIINPQTGYPFETDMISISIIADTSLDAEIWSTRLFGKSYESIKATVEETSLDYIINYHEATYTSLQGGHIQ